MKKFIAIPLFVLYLIAISGMMVQLHFCGPELSSWNVNKPTNSCRCAPGSAGLASPNGSGVYVQEQWKGCCSDKTITLKIAQDQNTSNGILLQFEQLQVAINLPGHVFPLSTDLAIVRTQPVYEANAPPGLWQNIPLYKLHSRLTYYG